MWYSVPFPEDITVIFMGALTDFYLSISEQPKLAYVWLKPIKISHTKNSPFLCFSSYYYSFGFVKKNNIFQDFCCSFLMTFAIKFGNYKFYVWKIYI